jgi:hypothetical protein
MVENRKERTFEQRPGKYSPYECLIAGKLSEEKGSHANVFELKEPFEGKEYVLKVGKLRNYKPPLLKGLPFSVNRNALDKIVTSVFGTKSVEIYPSPEHTVRAYLEEYLPIKNYLTPVSKEEFSKDPRQEMLKDFKNPNSLFYREMLKLLGDKQLIEKLDAIFGENKNYNFLKNECVDTAPPLDLSIKEIEAYEKKGKPLPLTDYIFQEKVKDNPAGLVDLDIDILRMRPLVLKRLITFALLQRKMYMDLGKLIDTRPREIIRNYFDWFGKTDNLLVTEKDDVVFIDTRWLWDKKTRIIGEHWLNLIDHVGRKSVDRAIKTYMELLDK